MKDSTEPLRRKPDAVLIDLDDTLYAYSPAHAAGTIAARNLCGERLGLEPQAFEETFERAKSDVKARLGATAASHHRLLYFQRMIEMITGKSDASLSLDLEKAYWRRFIATARIFPGARDVIDELRYQKIPTALVTDLTAQVQMRKIVYFELEHAFDVVVTSEEAGAEKPDPRIFKLALSKLGLEGKGPHVWMIGESAKKDVDGARQAVSAVTLQKLHHGVEVAENADYHFRDFGALAEVLRTLFARSDAPHG
jgi:HAD superfamily hydrolase (TIGR01549 family)